MYRLNSDSGGVSIKLTSNQSIDTTADIATAFDQSYITQFKYIYIFYILSDFFYNIFNIDRKILYSFVVYSLELDKITKNC